MTTRASRRLPCALLLGLLSAIGCDDDDDQQLPPDDAEASSFVELDASVCDPVNGPFSVDVDNEFFPLPPGRELVLEGDEEATLIHLEITVPGDVEVVAGVVTTVMVESEFEDGELVEVSRNFFAQARDGTVCYFGEEVDDFEDGEIVGHGGTWRAGEGDNMPGILMPGMPHIRTRFQQERAPGIAEDASAIMAIGGPVIVPAGTAPRAITTLDWNPLEGQDSADGERKEFASGIGVVVDGPVELVSFTL